ncbi:Guanine nucleotide-binding protein alpha-2 subunit [Apostasia shenzhenica]|uniref:Guanine nucleotide-binding protein alpha-2 subunit n=1 Tax=Apostasia shenzhenica TaxID=1088818 RepID=A0A2I0AMN7_9ASPA|nr:Guanine nucleotide-binding protein alpha-2 subunit [Apostasia shenzhenica]
MNTVVAVDYAFAVEYTGPPIPYEIPQAIPIEIERIPVATVAAAASLPDHLLLPVVQPLPSPDPLKKPPPPPSEHAVSSPTSVIENHIAPDGELSGEVESSGAVVFCSELKGSPDSADGKHERISMESALSYDFGFRSSASVENEFADDDDDDEDDDGVFTSPVRRGGVSFRDSAESSGAASSGVGVEYQVRDEEYDRTVKKGACYRCLKGTRFTEKEACLVCDVKYCSSCVLRAMGSMPEGRKCVSCIGSPIDESKRERLGKSSRMLKRLLSSLEVEQVMKAEKYCEANQLRPEDICVNGKPLTQEEVVLLQRCPCPPLKLKPGYYWYDKVSGFWGKVRFFLFEDVFYSIFSKSLVGHKPDKIISPNLNVGGSIMCNASNGNTGVLINGREITKVELQMLKWAGVQCAGNPHFWVNADGTYQEEGQKNIKGQIWGRTRTKLFCSFLSLPVPSKAVNACGEEVNVMLNRAVHDYIEQRTTQRLLLFGNHGSGSSILFKQAKFLYKSVPFSEDEIENIKLMIQTNIYSYLGILLEAREFFEAEHLVQKRNSLFYDSSSSSELVMNEHATVMPYSISPRLKAFSDSVLEAIASGNLEAIFPASTREHAPLIEELWNDSAIQATYSRKTEIQVLSSVACYFLDQVVEISRVDYEPSKLDILYAERMTSTNGLASMDFLFPQYEFERNDLSEQDSLLRYQLIRLHTQGLGENLKWLDIFEDAQLGIFCIAASDYDEFYENANGEIVNRMMESKKHFEGIVSHPACQKLDFLLILNKFDLLEQKVEKSPLTVCDWFDNFNPVISLHRPNKQSRSAQNCATLAQTAFHYIAVKFKRLFYSLTGNKLFVTMANVLDSDSADAALRYARDILRWKEERPAPNDEMCSTDHSSYSH